MTDGPVTHVTIEKDADASQTFVVEHARGVIRFGGRDHDEARFTPTDDPTLAPFTASQSVFGDPSVVRLPAGESGALLVRRTGRRPLLLVTGPVAEADALRRNNPGLTVLSTADPGAGDLLEAPQRATRIPPCR